MRKQLVEECHPPAVVRPVERRDKAGARRKSSLKRSTGWKCLRVRFAADDNAARGWIDCDALPDVVSLAAEQGGRENLRKATVEFHDKCISSCPSSLSWEGRIRGRW